MNENQNEYVDINAHDNYPDSEQKIEIPTMKVIPLKKICMTIGELPTSYLETMTYYEMLIWFIEYLKNNIIPTVNNNAEAIQEVQSVVLALQNYINDYKDSIDSDVEELEEYMNNYFENLDVQEEINNKLDDMLEDGVLEQIIEQFLQLTSLICFDNVASMKQSTNLANGSYAKTLGYYSINDGGSALYKVRTITNDDVVDEKSIIALYDNTLIAEIIVINNTINVKQFGAYGDNIHDDKDSIQATINWLNNGKVYIPKGSYKCSTSITCKQDVDIDGGFDYLYTQSSDLGLLFNDTDGLINSYRNKISNLIIQNTNDTKTKAGIITNGGIVEQCTIRGFRNGIDCAYHSVTAIKCQINNNYFGIYNPNDSRIINCTFASNENHAINMQTGANDNIISNNKIEWNGGNGINGYGANNNVIIGNLLDRNASQGISFTGGANTTITGNTLRRNGVTATSTKKTQFRFDNVSKYIISSNTTATGNSQDDGTGDVVPTYAIRIMNSTDVLTIGNNFNGGTNSSPISLSSNTNLQMFDMGYDIPDMLKGTVIRGTANSSNTVVLSVPGAKAATGQVPQLQKVNYQVRRTDNGGYEAGEMILSNFRVWGSATSTSAKCSVSSILTNINIAVSYNLDTEKYDITFTNADDSHSFNITLTPIDI